MTGLSRRRRYGKYIRWILAGADFVMLNAALGLTVTIIPTSDGAFPRLMWLLANMAYIPAVIWLKNIQTDRTVAMEHVFGSSLKAVALHATLFLSCLFFLRIVIPLQSFLLFYGLMFVMFPIWWTLSRIIVKYYRRRGINYTKVVIAGDNPVGRRLYRELISDAGYGFRVLGFFDSTAAQEEDDGLYHGLISQLRDFIAEKGVDEVFCALPESRCDDISATFKAAQDNVIQCYVVPHIAAPMSRAFDLYSIGAMTVMSVRPQPLGRFHNRLIKRLLDLAVSSAVLLVSPFLFIPIAVVIKLTSPGPVFFSQKRTGYKGKAFTCYKFRTMRVNDEADISQATENDPRKTRTGDFLRRTSLDELPQFLNVWLGNMSVVGPRPHMLSQTRLYSEMIDSYMVRHYIKPGITGWAQINGFRGRTEKLWQMSERVRHDVWYIEHWTFLLDLKIMARTVFNALAGEKNAY